MGNGAKMPNAGATRSRRRKVIVVNASGGAISPGNWVQLKVGDVGERGGKLPVEKWASGKVAMGVVDPDSHSSDLANGAPMTVVLHGPTRALSINPGGGTIAVADRLIASATAGVATPSAAPGSLLVGGLAREAKDTAEAVLVKVYVVNPLGIPYE
jgi:hypothetical protein